MNIRDLDAPFGAEVVGLAASVNFDAQTIAQLRGAFDDRSLLLFRGLNADHPLQVRLTEILIGNDRGSAPGLGRLPDDILYVSNRRGYSAGSLDRLPFHSEAMWSNFPPLVLSLAAVDVEPPVTPTMFASAVHAWTALPADLRAHVDGQNAVHIAGLARRGYDDDVLNRLRLRRKPDDRPDRKGGGQEQRVAIPQAPAKPARVIVPTFDEAPSTVTPICYEHPRTGRRLLQVCEQQTREIVGLSPEDSETTLSELFAHLYDPATRWEHEWHNGDLIVWDNLAVQHARMNVPADGPARTLRKYFSPIPMLRQDQLPASSRSSE